MHDLRISVIDRCNFRCNYCMPAEEPGKPYRFLPKDDWLTFGEIVRLVKILIPMGVKKVRLTGGEPLLRPDLEHLVKQLADLPGLEDLALTTNGIFLGGLAVDLKSSGLKRLTVSLDTLDDSIFQKINGGKGSVKKVLEGIATAKRNGFHHIKINCVVQKDINEHGLLDLVKYCRKEALNLRFIEYMDVGNCNHWDIKAVVASKEILTRVHEIYPVRASQPDYYGEVAKRYRFIDGKGEIGFISSVSQPFCRDCTRMRLSTDGKLLTCLFSSTGLDLRKPLREGATDDEISTLITALWHNRRDKYSEERGKVISLNNTTNKMEMFQIGG